MSWRRFFRRGRSDAELQQEIELHLAEEIAENVERGMSSEEARRQAYLKFGSPRRVREELWRQNTISIIDSLWRDLSHVFRRLAKSPSTVLTVVVSLALGIAANVVIFSAVSRLMLQGPPVGHLPALLNLYPTRDHNLFYDKFSLPMYDEVRDQAKSFSGVAAYDDFLPASIGGPGEPERIWGQGASTTFFDVAQLPMTLGRGFSSTEDHSPVIVLSYNLWRRHFNGDAAIVGKVIPLSGRSFTVVGVATPGFHGINRLLYADFWVPLGIREQLAAEPLGSTDSSDRHALESRETHTLDVIGRLKPGVSRVQAGAELDAMAERFALAYPKTDKDLSFYLEQAGALLPSQRAAFGMFLVVLNVVALLVLCIAISNVANLLLVRAAAQHRETAVRIALGATRFQLIRPMLLESTLLALVGGVFGMVLCIGALRSLAVFQLPAFVPIDLSFSVDWRVLLYAFLLSVGTGLLCGVGPAWTGSRPVLPNSLKGESTLERPGRRWSLRNVLVVLQVSLCLVLLCMTGLFLRSLKKAAGIDPGFRSSGVLMVSIDPRQNGYTDDQSTRLLTRLRDHIKAMPGVVSVALTDIVQLSIYGNLVELHVEGSAPTAGHDPHVDVYQVSAGYFDTMGIPRLAGRSFDTTDPNAPKQAVVNEAFVQKIFGRGNAIGERVVSKDATYEIVGVVRNTKSLHIGEMDRPILYGSLEQNMKTAPSFLGLSLLVHYSGNAAEVASAVRNEIREQDPALAIFNEKTMEEHLSEALMVPRAAAAIFAVFGSAGLLLAVVGLYGLMSYSVSSRTQEIGIRLALGATRSGMRRLIVRQGMLLSCIALGIGLPVALAASKVSASVLYGIAPHDWVTFTMVPVFLAVVTLLACWIPARRAAAVEPQVALRHE